MLRWLPLALSALFWADVLPAVEDSQPAILEIVANDLNHGQKFVQVTGDGDVLLTPKVLEQLRLKPELWADQEGGHISLRSLAPELKFTLNENDARVNLSVPLRWYDEQVIIPESPPATTVKFEPVFPEPSSGFLNYAVRADMAEAEGLTSVEAPLEIGYNRGQWLALNTLNSRYDARTDEGDMLRQRTTVVWDDSDNMRTLGLGDFVQPFGHLLGGGAFGGVSWRKNYGIDRTFRRTADLGMELQIESPTRAELLINGRVAEEWDLLPGVVSFPDLGTYAVGDAELVLTDAFGRVRHLEIPSHTSQRVLRRSLHDYAYGFGWRRENPGEQSFEYGRPAAMGYHRYGFGRNWTGGVEFALTSDELAFGPSLVALIGGFSQAEFGLIASRDSSHEVGYTAAARYGFGYRRVNAFVGATWTSRDYVRVPSVSDIQNETTPRLNASANLSYSTDDWGAFGVSYMENHTWNEALDPVRVASLSYRKQLFGGLHLSLGMRHDLSGENDEGMLMLRYRPVDTRQTLFDNAALISRNHRVNGTETEVNVQKSSPRGLGFGYSTSLLEKQGELYGTARGDYRNQQGIYTASVSRSDRLAGSVSIAGGVAMIDRELYSGTPITDSFAVVRLDGVDSAIIANGSAIAGLATAEDGLLVSDLTSYGLNELAIDDPNLSLNYTSGQMRQVVQVGQRSGSIVTFKFTKFSAVDGELYVQGGDGERVALEYLPIEYSVNGENREAFVGQGGYFYLEDIPVGKQVLRVRRWGGDCLATFDVPDSDRLVQSLGATLCVPEQDAAVSGTGGS